MNDMTTRQIRDLDRLADAITMFLSHRANEGAAGAATFALNRAVRIIRSNNTPWVAEKLLDEACERNGIGRSKPCRRIDSGGDLARMLRVSEDARSESAPRREHETAVEWIARLTRERGCPPSCRPSCSALGPIHSVSCETRFCDCGTILNGYPSVVELDVPSICLPESPIHVRVCSEECAAPYRASLAREAAAHA